MTGTFGALALLVWLSGCAAKNGDSQTSVAREEQALLATREASLGARKGAVVATLLNRAEPQRYPDEKGVVFLIGVLEGETVPTVHLNVKNPKA